MSIEAQLPANPFDMTDIRHVAYRSLTECGFVQVLLADIPLETLWEQCVQRAPLLGTVGSLYGMAYTPSQVPGVIVGGLDDGRRSAVFFSLLKGADVNPFFDNVWLPLEDASVPAEKVTLSLGRGSSDFIGFAQSAELAALFELPPIRPLGSSAPWVTLPIWIRRQLAGWDRFSCDNYHQVVEDWRGGRHLMAVTNWDNVPSLVFRLGQRGPGEPAPSHWPSTCGEFRVEDATDFAVLPLETHPDAYPVEWQRQRFLGALVSEFGN